MKRRKFMKGLAAILGIAVIPSVVFSGQDLQSWTLIIRDIEEMPKELWIELRGEKCGKGWQVDLKGDKQWIPNAGTGFKGKDIRIAIEPGPERDNCRTVLISYKYKGMKCSKRILIATQCFHNKNNYTFGVRLLGSDDPCDEVNWADEFMSWHFSTIDLRDPKNFGIK